MSYPVRVRKSGGDYRVVFEGQSLNNHPDFADCGSYLATFPAVAMSGRNIPWAVPAIDGYPWNWLVTTRPALLEQLGHATTNIIVFCGGQTDIWSGQSGADIYTELGTHVTAARGQGFDYCFAITSTPNVVNTLAQEMQRQNYNAALVADASGFFDGVVNTDLITELDDFMDSTYYLTGNVHWNVEGARLVGEALRPLLDAVLV